ncbi:MAG: DinB family protein [Anaerolineales bacterium]
MFDLLKESHAILQITPLHWNNLVKTLSPELLNRPPAEGEWSVVKCLQHLVDTEKWVFPLRVEAFLAGEDFPAFDPDTQGGLHGEGTAEELAAEFADLRKKSLVLIESLTPADLERTATHSALGTVTLGEMIHEWAGHDLNHLVQAERALMQPFIAGCGPWQVYFEDHLIK